MYAAVSVFEEVKNVVVETLGIQSRAQILSPESPLFGSLPELDSFGVIELGMALETRFGFVMQEDDFTADIFETMGTLADFVEKKSIGSAVSEPA